MILDSLIETTDIEVIDETPKKKRGIHYTKFIYILIIFKIYSYI